MARENPGDVVYERPACGLDERGVPLTPKPIDGGSNVMLLRANRTGVSVRALLEKYGIETSREYKIKSRRGLNSLRSTGAPVPLKLDDGVSPLAALIYNRGDPNATNRSLLDVLRERAAWTTRPSPSRTPARWTRDIECMGVHLLSSPDGRR